MGDNYTQAVSCQGSSAYAEVHVHMPSGYQNGASASGATTAEAVTQASTSGESGDGFVSGTNIASSYCWGITNESTFSTPFPICAVPAYYHQVLGYDNGGGNLKFVYDWRSNTGSLADLSACVVREFVTYPGTSPFIWPSPPFQPVSVPWPVITGVSGPTGRLIDEHLHVDFRTPYNAVSFSATQYYQYICPCANGGQPVDVMGPLSIDRSVYFVSPNGTWQYKVTKSGVSAVTTLP